MVLVAFGFVATPSLAAKRIDPSTIPGLDSAVRQSFRGWVIDEVAEGDLNGDARPDVVVTFKRPDEERAPGGDSADS